MLTLTLSLSLKEREITLKTENGDQVLKENILKKIRSKVSKAKLEDISVEINGRWLIKNNLVEIWKEIRQNPNEEIGLDYRIQITLLQAEKMGIIRRI